MADRRPATLWLKPADFGIFVAYVAMLCVFVPFHEPWEDEAQAWLLARDLSLYRLLFHALRHEGHPALWYLLLWIPTHLHVSYALFNWLSAAIASAGVYVLLRFAPFPFYLRALLPFTFFLAYQYSVVARSYVLFPILGFLVAHLFRGQPPRPVLMAVLLSLLANVSVHGTIVALAFALLYAWKLKRYAETQGNTPPAPRDTRLAIGIFSASIIFVAICLWPTAGALPRVGPTLNKIIDALSVHDSAHNTQQTPLPAPANLTPVEIASPATTLHPKGRIANIPLVLGFAFASSWPLAALFDGVLLLYLQRGGNLKLALPAALLFLFLIFVYGAPWHLGLLWITVLMILWAAWDTSIPPQAPRLQNAVAIFLGVLCVLQLPWTFHAFRFDLNNPTSPNKATAAYLKAFPSGLRIAGFGTSVGVQPYFTHNIFFNRPETYAVLIVNPASITIPQAIALHPDLIVSDASFTGMVERGGYRPIQAFCGSLYFPNIPILPTCLTIYKPSAPSQTAP